MKTLRLKPDTKGMIAVTLLFSILLVSIYFVPINRYSINQQMTYARDRIFAMCIIGSCVVISLSIVVLDIIGEKQKWGRKRISQ